MASRPFWGAVCLLMVLLAFSGCTQLDDRGLDEDSLDTNAEPVPGSVTVLDEGRLEVTVPVNVAVIGFDEATAEALTERLKTERVEHAYASWPRNAPPPEPTDPAKPAKLPLIPGPVGWEWYPMPIVPIAEYRVHVANATLEEATAAALQAATSGSTLDANPVEDALHTALPEHGIPVDPNAPTLVLMHAAALLDRPTGDHSWTYTLPGGPMENVRVFGEKTPLLVLDASAQPDPWTSYEGQETPPYGEPLAKGGQAVVDALEQAARDATHLRLLQGTFYPLGTQPCHTATLLLGDPGSTDPATLLDVARLQQELDTITGPLPFHLDAKTLNLPREGPVLHAFAQGTLADRDPIRTWADENWDTYVVPHEGCEEYLLFATVTERSFDAIAIYGHDEDRRLGLAIAPGTWEAQADAMERYILHELGHLIGPAHPHTYTPWNGEASYPLTLGEVNSRWSSIWSASSYQTGGGYEGGPTLGLEYGIQDRANTLRNQAGFAYAAVQEAGLQDEEKAAEALAAMERLDWASAVEHLLSLLAQAS